MKEDNKCFKATEPKTLEDKIMNSSFYSSVCIKHIFDLE